MYVTLIVAVRFFETHCRHRRLHRTRLGMGKTRWPSWLSSSAKS